MKQKANRIRIIITYLTAYLITFSTIVRSQSGFQGKSFQTPVTIPLTIFVILFVIEPLLSRQSHRLTHIYLGVQTIVVSYLMLIPPYADYFAVLFVAIIMQAIFALPEKIGIRWVVAITLVMTGLILYGHGFAAGIGYIINYILSNLIIAGLLIFSDRAETARNESQRLLSELQTAHEQLQAFTEQAEELAVLKERNRLARDLHDSVTQALYSQTLYAEAASRLLVAGDLQTATEHIAELKHTAQQAFQEMRLLIYELRPTVLEDEGIEAALKMRLESVEERSGLATKFNIEGTIDLPKNIEDAFYWISQEILNNVIKYALANKVEVQLKQLQHTISLDIFDDGVGFDPSSQSNQSGLGLRGIQERADQIGGNVIIDSQPGKGTRVCVEVQL